MEPILVVLPALLAALITTGLFLFGLWQIVRTFALREKLAGLIRALGLTRAEENPLLRSTHSWEAGGVFNPAAVATKDRTHLFYRSVGADGVSRIGYAASGDDKHIDERLPYPVFALAGNPDTRAFASNSGLSASGGSFAGVEDPRAVVIEDRVYLSFNAFSGWDSLRIGVSSLGVDDLLAGRWKWTSPVFLSPRGEVHKSWVLFPEKIANKFAVLHGFSKDRTRANIAYLDSLDHEPTPHIRSDASFRDSVDEEVWDSRIRGAGPPPLKTSKGWLVFYHANDSVDSHRYKLGAMLLDLDDPTKVIARSPVPVLSPDASYENEGKPGIVYACGATLKGDVLRVYYGGADAVVCAATTSLAGLLEKLVEPYVSPKAALRNALAFA